MRAKLIKGSYGTLLTKDAFMPGAYGPFFQV